MESGPDSKQRFMEQYNLIDGEEEILGLSYVELDIWALAQLKI